jgi:hypothetical protein
VRRLLLVPALALVVTSAAATSAGAGDGAVRGAVGGRVALGGGVNVVLPAGWHRVGRISEVTDPIPLALATFPVRLARTACECGMPRVRDFPRTGALVVAWEYRRVSRRDLRSFPAHAARFRIGRSAIAGACAPSDGRAFREAGRGFDVEIYLGPDAPASVRRQIAAILDSWRVAT